MRLGTTWIRRDGWTRLAFQKVPEGKTVKNRPHLDIGVSDIAEATGQAEALVLLVFPAAARRLRTMLITFNQDTLIECLALFRVLNE